MYKNLLMVGLFFLVTPITIMVSFFSLITLQVDSSPKKPLTNQANLIDVPLSGVKVYASLPSSSSTIEANIMASDARSEILKNYLGQYSSPLTPFAGKMVEEADKYGVDFRLTTAIAQQESNLCKKIPADSNNCWGWGIHSGGTLGFNSLEEGIETVTRGLRLDYIDQGFVTADKIMTKYTPSSDGSWAYAVNKFMEVLK
ncbi:hypothetical protein A2627_05010 [Candidatus Woesebacteria bacterium RIFCSPHIGHO2_01_FULL_39_28]|uniref:Mannosyl-glycoprotein endo-beta-N-acetylglucosamidase-like domain-containing protein n=1 Tax=Candidatus Woesebacteria bacterium RIFCSPHIGHO2_01_FULL_39_28 TaxID=1802496 RepID=A0A1F7YCE7_9BACT|nr:MAG: hypothetical protein A2627_05010 [Candidatus Woesebacteria bacterium RIFCSPHIGHO2_01_FULL_39_28]